MNVSRSDARTAQRAARNRARRRDVRVRAVIDVQKRSLGTFEEDTFPRADFLIEYQSSVCHILPELFAIPDVLIMDFLEVERFLFEDRLEINVFLFDVVFEFFFKGLLFEQVYTADTDPSHFVLVSRTNPATGGANFTFAAQSLAREIDGLVVGHDEMRFFADPQQGVID